MQKTFAVINYQAFNIFVYKASPWGQDMNVKVGAEVCHIIRPLVSRGKESCL